ncbi:MAG: hypothetical protein ABW080_19735 [Candidatus Thiodiazotropha sp.]
MHYWEINSVEQYFIKPVLLQVRSDNVVLSVDKEYSFETILNFDKDIFITGAPGSGKTALLKYLENLIKGQKEYTGVYISLREILYFEHANTEVSAGGKKIIFLLDGLDEIPVKSRDETTRKIEALKQEYPEACFIVTSRLFEEYELANFNKFTVLRISELNDAQLESLFKRHGIDNWAKAFSTIQSSVALRNVVRNPFMAKLVIQYYDVIESNNYIVDPTLYIDRLATDYIYKESKYAGISGVMIERFLQEIAAFLHYNGVHILSRPDIYSLAYNAYDKSHEVFNIDPFLEEMKRGYIFHEIEPDLYTFSHRGIFEHFLTKHLRKLVGYHESKLILDTSQSIVIAIKLKGLKAKDALKKILANFEKSLGLTSSQVTPVYAREGSIEILLALAVGGAAIHAFKKFSDGFFTKLGHIAAEINTSNKNQITLPRGLKEQLPSWIRENDQAMEIFTNELIQQYARNIIADEKATVSIAINSVLTAQYGDCYEKISISQFNDISSLSNEVDASKRKG